MIVNVNLQADTADLELVALVLAEGADRRRRTGIQASAELEDDRRRGANVDAQALLVVSTLAEGDTLDTWAKSFAAAVQTARTAPAPAPQAPAVTAAVEAARRAVQDARARSAAPPPAIPSIEDLADQYNASLAGAQPAAAEPQIVDGRPVWVAPEVYADDTDDELPNAEDAVAGYLEPQPQPGTPASPAVAVDLTRR
jgi:hypothetical protein